MKIKSLIAAAITALILSACSGKNFDVYYNACAHAPTIPLAEKERARVVEAMEPQEALKRYEAEGYVIIGMMNFSSERISNKEVADYATKKGASLVLAMSKRTGSIEKTYAVPVTSTSTTYHSGTISSTNYWGPSYNVSGTSTTTHTDWQTRSYSVGYYDYLYLFLAKKS